jgi:hypothetical protein
VLDPPEDPMKMSMSSAPVRIGEIASPIDSAQASHFEFLRDRMGSP